MTKREPVRPLRGVLAIARTELARRRTLLVIGLVLGVLPVMVGIFVDRPPAEVDIDPSNARMIMNALAAMAWVAALVIGVSLGRELHDGRLAFYFTRPITQHGIACGKLVGCVLLIGGLVVVLLGPFELYEAVRTRPDDCRFQVWVSGWWPDTGPVQGWWPARAPRPIFTTRSGM